MLRGDHWEIWVTIALTAASNRIALNDDFWKRLDKYITFMVVLISNRCSTIEAQSYEVLNRCYEEIRVILERQQFRFEIEAFEIAMFVNHVKGESFKILTDFSLTYLLMRVNMDLKVDSDNIIDKMRFHSIVPFYEPTDLKEFSSHIGNFILVNYVDYDKFHGKDGTKKGSGSSAKISSFLLFST